MSTVTIPEVVGSMQLGALRSHLETQCKATSQAVDPASRSPEPWLVAKCRNGPYLPKRVAGGFIKSNHSYPQVIVVDFPSLPEQTDKRASKLAEHGECMWRWVILALPTLLTILQTRF